MKKLIALLLILSTLSLFGCRGDMDNSLSDITADDTTTEEVTTVAPDYSQMQCIARGTVSVDDIGMSVAECKISNPYIVNVEIYRESLTILGYTPGTTTVELTDFFGHTASLTATVNADSEEVVITTEKCKDEFIEVRQFGAVGNGVKDDTKAFQAALDSASPGETVYVYPGRYKVTLLSMREGVTLKMYTEMTDAKQGYTDKIAKDVNEQKYAILSGTRILNTENEGKGTTGVSNFSIIGGVIDSNCKNASVALFACADNFRLENIIFKDLKSGHTLQIMGCKNSVLENCMFAGYKCGTDSSKETIQIEPSRPNATGGPITFEEGEFYYSENISINNCYFGKSDEAGPHLIAIGDHCSVGGVTVKNFKITNNFFDECIYASIKYNNLTDVEISGNTFISTAEYTVPDALSVTPQPAFIYLYSSNNGSKYITPSGASITEAVASEQSGLHNINIKNNTFTLKEGSDKRVLYYSTRKTTPGVSFLSEIKRQDTHTSPVYDFSGYSVNTNFVEDIFFTDNTINIDGQPKYFNYFLHMLNVYNLKYENNTLNLTNGAFFSYENQGQYFTHIDLFNAYEYPITTRSTDKTITLNFNGTSYTVFSSFSGTITLKKSEGGYIKAKTDVDGNLIVDIIPAEGYELREVINSSGKALSHGSIRLFSSTFYYIYFAKK